MHASFLHPAWLALTATAISVAACGSSTKNPGGTGGTGGTGATGGASSSTSSASSSASSATGPFASSSSTSASASSGSSSSTASSSSGTGATQFPFPQAVYGGGPVLSAPNVVTVTFPGNGFASDLASFGAKIASSSYWTSITSDLTCGGASPCIGPGPAGSAAVSPVAIGSSYADFAGPGGPGNTLQPFLEAVIAALPSSQQPQANSLYVFYVPPSTTLSLDGEQGCTSFGGYHNTMMVGGNQVVYAIVLDCGPRETLSEEQAVTFAASHEILEAASDPIISTTSAMSGYALDPNLQSSYPWLTLSLSELGDLCVDFLSLGEDIATENGFSVQRMWSVANAATGTMDPCVPSNGEVYFNGFPTVSAVIVDVGKSTTFEVDALALGNEPTWTLAVEDATTFGKPDQYLAFSIAGGNNVSGVGVVAANSGDHFQVTVEMLKDPGSAPGSLGWGLGIVACYDGLDPQASTMGHYWPFMVLTPAEASQNGVTMTESVPKHVLERLTRKAARHARPIVPRSRFLGPLLPLLRSR